MTDKLASKLKNWWWYHKKVVLLAIAAGIAGLYILSLNSLTADPDYHIGLVAAAAFSPEQLAQIEDTFCNAGQDLNNDGQILVQLHTYHVDLADDTPNAGYNHYEIAAALDGDLVGRVSGIFLLEDPEAFQQTTNGVLSDTVLPWEDGLYLAIRSDADAAYTQLFDYFR